MKISSVLALAGVMFALAAATSTAQAGDRVGNGSPMSLDRDTLAKCTFHHSKACGGALAAMSTQA